MDHNSLTQFYDTLKSDLNTGKEPVVDTVNGSIFRPRDIHAADKYHAWRTHAVKHCDELKDKCAKHIILDIYMKILPLDKEYITGHIGQCKNDIDAMLNKKGMNGVQYLRSCYESTHAPLLEFINRSIDTIGRTYMKEADETIKDAKEHDIELPNQEEPSTDNANVNSQLVDVKQDPEYETFIDKLKSKTVNKIVNDITKIINDKKEDKNMEFNLKSNDSSDDSTVDDSAVQESMNYMQKKCIKENKKVDPEKEEEMIGLAIREATLFQFDRVFNQRSFNEFANAMRLGHGVLVNESAINNFIN